MNRKEKKVGGRVEWVLVVGVSSRREDPTYGGKNGICPVALGVVHVTERTSYRERKCTRNDECKGECCCLKDEEEEQQQDDKIREMWVDATSGGEALRSGAVSVSSVWSGNCWPLE